MSRETANESQLRSRGGNDAQPSESFCRCNASSAVQREALITVPQWKPRSPTTQVRKLTQLCQGYVPRTHGAVP